MKLTLVILAALLPAGPANAQTVERLAAIGCAHQESALRSHYRSVIEPEWRKKAERLRPLAGGVALALNAALGRFTSDDVPWLQTLARDGDDELALRFTRRLLPLRRELEAVDCGTGRNETQYIYSSRYEDRVKASFWRAALGEHPNWTVGPRQSHDPRVLMNKHEEIRLRCSGRHFKRDSAPLRARHLLIEYSKIAYEHGFATTVSAVGVASSSDITGSREPIYFEIGAQRFVTLEPITSDEVLESERERRLVPRNEDEYVRSNQASFCREHRKERPCP